MYKQDSKLDIFLKCNYKFLSLFQTCLATKPMKVFTPSTGPHAVTTWITTIGSENDIKMKQNPHSENFDSPEEVFIMNPIKISK